MKPSFKFSIALTALCAFILGWITSQHQPIVHASPHIQGPYIQNAPMDRGDIGKLLRIEAFKFEFVLPDQHPCYAVFWLEFWQRNNLKPVLHHLANLSINGDHAFMLKLPRDRADEFVVATDNVIVTGHLPELRSPMNGGSGVLADHVLDFDKDIVLASAAQDNLQAVKYDMLGIEKCNDQVRLLKLRFTKAVPRTLKWQNGHVVFQ